MTTRRTIRLACGVAAALLVLAGCGSSGGGNTSSAGKSTTTAAKSTKTAASGVAKIKDDAMQGSILANDKGFTLYTLTSGGKAVDCTGACLDAWPPATVPSGTAASTVGGVKLATTKAADGTLMLTADGLPLYTFSGDKTATDAGGEGLASFGGTWHVVKASGGGSTTTEAPATTNAPASGGGSGY